MPLTTPLPHAIWINPHPPPIYGRPPPQRKPLTDVAALALLDEATALAAVFQRPAQRHAAHAA